MSDPATPKPARNWRGYLKEYAIIVIGVLTALAAQQAAEWWHWRDQAQGARHALAHELGRNIANGAQRVVAAACVDRRLDHLADLLDTASRSGMLPPIAPAAVGVPSQNDWPSSAWDSVINSEVVSHIPRHEINALGLVYQQIQMLARLNEQELIIWADLSAMVGPGRRLDPTLDTSLHLALSRARLLDRTVAINSAQVVQRAQALALPYDDDDRQLIAQTIARRRGCNTNPKATVVPPRYGQASGVFILEMLREFQKHPPYTNARQDKP